MAQKEMPTKQNNYAVTTASQDTKPARKNAPKLKDKTFKQKLRDAFIAEEVHDIKDYMIFGVVIPAIKTTFRNLVVNSLDISLFGKTQKSGNGGKPGGGSYISYDRAYNSNQQQQSAPQAKSSNSIDVRELDRVWFETKEDAEEQIRVIRETYDYNEGVLSVAEFLDAAQIKPTPIHTKWGWIDISNVSAEPYPDGSGWYVNLPRPRPL